MKKNIKYIFSIVFLCIVFYGFFSNSSNLKENAITAKNMIKEIGINAAISSFENGYNQNFYGKLSLVNINGAYRRVLGQTVIGDVIRVNDSLTMKSEITYDANVFFDDIEYTKVILNYADANGISTLYVQHPTKINTLLNQLPYDKNKNAVNTDEYWLEKIVEGGYNVLNLCEDEYSANTFYRTDHHWTNESALNAANAILDSLNINTDVCRKKKYKEDIYVNSFLGSAGIRVGKSYVGKDDFSVYIPKFETNLMYKKLVDNEVVFEASGDFNQCFINRAIIDDENYNNKYNAFLNGGYVENIILNRNCNNDKKILIISDSFARPMTQYLSLAFSETRYLDPQDGRFNDSCIDYIKKYEPDYLIIMYSLNYQDEMLECDMLSYNKYLS